MPAGPTDSDWTVIYRTGGTDNARWRAMQPCRTRYDADVMADYCARMGYKPMVFVTAQLNALGMPAGFDASCDPVTGAAGSN